MRRLVGVLLLLLFLRDEGDGQGDPADLERFAGAGDERANLEETVIFPPNNQFGTPDVKLYGGFGVGKFPNPKGKNLAGTRTLM
jgi:hypothetical protein